METKIVFILQILMQKSSVALTRDAKIENSRRRLKPYSIRTHTSGGLMCHQFYCKEKIRARLYEMVQSLASQTTDQIRQVI